MLKKIHIARVTIIRSSSYEANSMTKTQGCVFTKDINKAIMISDAMETGTVQINSAPARGPDHFPFQVIWFVRAIKQILHNHHCSLYWMIISFHCRVWEIAALGRKESQTVSTWWPRSRAQLSTYPLQRTPWVKKLEYDITCGISKSQKSTTFNVCLLRFHF